MGLHVDYWSTYESAFNSMLASNVSTPTPDSWRAVHPNPHNSQTSDTACMRQASSLDMVLSMQADGQTQEPAHSTQEQTHTRADTHGSTPAVHPTTLFSSSKRVKECWSPGGFRAWLSPPKALHHRGLVSLHSTAQTQGHGTVWGLGFGACLRPRLYNQHCERLASVSVAVIS